MSLIDVPLIDLIWHCQFPETPSPALTLGEDGAVLVRAGPPSRCSSAPLSPSGKPELIAPAWTPTFPTPSPPKKDYFLKNLLTLLAFTPILPVQISRGVWSSQGHLKDKPGGPKHVLT